MRIATIDVQPITLETYTRQLQQQIPTTTEKIQKPKESKFREKTQK